MKYRYENGGYRYSSNNRLAPRPLKETEITTKPLSTLPTIGIGGDHRQPSPSPESPEDAQIRRSPIAGKLSSEPQ